MKRQTFMNRSITKDGKPIYELIFNNMMQSPEEVAKSKTYTILKDQPKAQSTVTITNIPDLVGVIEEDWTYGKTKFIVTYGPLISHNFDTMKMKIQFAGYWI